jgi:hypothetical protein
VSYILIEETDRIVFGNIVFVGLRHEGDLVAIDSFDVFYNYLRNDVRFLLYLTPYKGIVFTQVRVAGDMARHPESSLVCTSTEEFV